MSAFGGLEFFEEREKESGYGSDYRRYGVKGSQCED